MLSPINYRDKPFFTHAVLKVRELALSKKIHGVHTVLLQFKKSLFALFDASEEFVN